MPRRNRKAIAHDRTVTRPQARALVATFGPWATHDPNRCRCASCR